MNTSSDPAGATVSVLRIIVAAMGGAVVAFLAVAVGLVESGGMKTDPSLAKFLMPIIGVLALGGIAGYAVVRAGMIRKLHTPLGANTSPADAPTPARCYSTITIIGCGLAEGLCMLATVTYLLSGNRFLLIAVVAALTALGVQWPSREKLASFAAPRG